MPTVNPLRHAMTASAPMNRSALIAAVRKCTLYPTLRHPQVEHVSESPAAILLPRNPAHGLEKVWLVEQEPSRREVECTACSVNIGRDVPGGECSLPGESGGCI